MFDGKYLCVMVNFEMCRCLMVSFLFEGELCTVLASDGH